jgi:hypothetical protein
MKRILGSLFCATLVVGFSSGAFAQATRTWVSGVGDDANPCSRTAPCKTFAGAISKTADKGEISVLDPGGFGVVTITKGITLNGTGTLAGILSAGSPGAITVNDAAAAVPNSSVVIIRDISMNGAGTGTSGVRYLSGKTVMLDHSWVYGMTSRGIDVSKTADGNLKVINGSVIENVGEDGIHLTTTVGTVVAIVDNASIMNCGQDGIEAVTNVRGEITRSSVEILAANGIMTSGGNCQLNVDDTTIAHANTTGLRASVGSSIRVSDSMIANNSTGVLANGGTIDSFQGNSLIGNPTPGTFSSTTLKQ